jgi:peptidoglycan glycosyltransferase
MAVVLVLALVLVASFGIGAYSTYAQIASSLKPRLATLTNREIFETSRIYDRNGALLYEFFEAGKRTRINLSDISPLLIKATIAIEDKTFFTNPGVDYEGIARTIYQSLRAGGEVGGASTITQQVIRGIILTKEERRYENRYERKIKEIILAQELSQIYTKEQILELYLNEIFYGSLAYGIEAASEVYFRVHAKDLTLPQASLLAGLPQLPSRYDPINYMQHDDRGSYLPGANLGPGWLDPNYPLADEITPPKWRQIAVLRQMVDEGYVTETEARNAAATDLRFADQEVPLHAPHFVFYVRKMLEEKYGKQLVSRGGLNIYTTLDLDFQRMVQREAAQHIESLKQRNIHNAAVVVLQPHTGQILAMVGSVDYNAVEATSTPGEEGNVLDGQVNVAIRERQPGSALKPFTYLAAMEQGMTPASVLWDVPTVFPTGSSKPYAPENYNGRWNGPVRIRMALANSLNMPAVKALKFAGIEYTLNFLDRVGIKSGLKRGPSHYGLSLTLGGGEVTLLELTTAYNTLASNGRYLPPTPILKITDNDGRVLESFQYKAGKQVVDAGLTSIIVNMLSDDEARAPIWGRNSKLKLSRPSAVKTGTSEDWRDAWTVGFTPYATVGVWSGNNNNEPTRKVESLLGGGIIWHNVMEELFTWIDPTHENYSPTLHQAFKAPFSDSDMPEAFSLPSDGSVETKTICRLPGAFGGKTEELFTRRMLYTSGYMTGTTTRRVGKIEGACDVYRSVTVVKTTSGGDAQYCRPMQGESYPPQLITHLTSWNIPEPEEGVKVSYRWSGGSAYSTNPYALPSCTTAMFAPPTPQPPEPTRTPPPPVQGAVQMPNLRGLGENQAKNVLARLGVHDVHVDHQTRDRIPGVFDSFAPYTVVSTLPQAGNWIYPGAAVILGVRAGDDAQSAPQSAPPPAENTATPIPQLDVQQPTVQPPATQPAQQPTLAIPENIQTAVPQYFETPVPQLPSNPPGGTSLAPPSSKRDN